MQGDDDDTQKRLFDQCSALLADPAVDNTPVAARFARWIWTMETTARERELCQGMATTTLARMLMFSMLESSGCEPGESGARSRRQSRATWLSQFVQSKSQSRLDPLSEDESWSGSHPNPPPWAQRSAKASRALEKSLSPVFGCAGSLGAASAFLPPPAPGVAIATGLTFFGALCLGAAAKMLNRSRLSPMIVWRLQTLRETYPDLADQGLLDQPRWGQQGAGPLAPTPEGKALRGALLGPSEPPTWIDAHERAFLERVELRERALPTASAAPSRQRL
jgi:hypothetical protein